MLKSGRMIQNKVKYLKSTTAMWYFFLLLLTSCSNDDCGYVKDHIIEGNTYYLELEPTDFQYNSKVEVSKDDYCNYHLNDYYCK